MVFAMKKVNKQTMMQNNPKREPRESFFFSPVTWGKPFTVKSTQHVKKYAPPYFHPKQKPTQQ